MLRLQSITDPHSVFEILGSADAILGRDASAKYQVEHVTVSRRHAVLSAREDQLLVRDLGSANGTFVNGNQLGGQEAALNPGDLVQFGALIFRVLALPTAAPVPPLLPPVGASRAATVLAGSQMQREMLAAIGIQEAMVRAPRLSIEGYRIAQFYQPARGLSGDFVVCATRASGELWTVIGDVCGKGSPSAMLMAFITGAARVLVHSASSPSALLDDLSTLVRDLDLPGMFATALALVVDMQTHRCEIALAGHHPAVLRHDDGTIIELHSPPGLPLGAPEAKHTVAQRFTLARGETVVLTSDGVDQCEAPDGGAFGNHRVAAVVAMQAEPDALVRSFTQELNAHRGTREWHDDATVVAIARV